MKLSLSKELVKLTAFTLVNFVLGYAATIYFSCVKEKFFYFTYIYLFLILTGIIVAAFKFLQNKENEKLFTGFLLVSLMAKLLFSLSVVTAYIFSEPVGKICHSLLFCIHYFAFTIYFISFILRINKG